MSTVDKEDWIHVDSYWQEIEDFENKIDDLKAALDSAEGDEVYVLSRLIETRWRYTDYTDLYEDLTEIIKLHREDVVDKALKVLYEQFPNTAKHPSSWGL